MRPRPFLLLLAGVALALMASLPLASASEDDDPAPGNGEMWAYGTMQNGDGGLSANESKAAGGEGNWDGGSTDLVYESDPLSGDVQLEEDIVHVRLHLERTCLISSCNSADVRLFVNDTLVSEAQLTAGGNGIYEADLTITLDEGIIRHNTTIRLEFGWSRSVDTTDETLYDGANETGVTFYTKAIPTATIDSISPSPARFDAEVTFNGTGSDSDGTVVAYEWTSDIDGFLSDEENFSITGFSVGNHTISFRVQNNYGEWSDWDALTLVVNPNAPPYGTIDSIGPTPAEKGAAVFFNGTGSDSDGTVVAYSWESSIDGNLSAEANFSSSDLSPDHHNIILRVQDNDGGWSDADSESLWIYTIPVAMAGDDTTVNSGSTVQFSGQGTDEDGTIAKYEWDFDGNGVYELSSIENGLTTYIYNNEGTFTAVLRVTDNDGFTATDSRVITVGDGGGGGDDGDGFLPAPSLAVVVAAVAVIALRGRY